MISIVICLALELFTSQLAQFRSYQWISVYSLFIKKLFKQHGAWDSPWGVVAIMLAPLAITRLIQAGLNQVWLGLFELIFGIAVLIFCLRYQSQDEWIDDLSDAAEQGDEDRIIELSEKIMGKPLDKQKDTALQVSESILGNINEQMFSVLLWFVLLGPMGALMYRLSWYLSEQAGMDLATPGFKQASNRLYAILNWLPARLLVIGYAIVGSFEDVMLAWRETSHEMEDMQSVNQMIVVNAGRGAIHIDRHINIDDEGNEVCGMESIKIARGLILRTMLAWGIVIAALTLAGWAS
ncbi:MAG: regulatory signaling modulator protein AmpE [Gammaproteobacteria bacterium]|nr:regulatory signaling modulator protein AmpE [Gammaproteobacteria bacterium]